MKIAPYSDLHLEMYYLGSKRTAEKIWTPTVFEDDKENTILTLAGDIWYGSRVLEWIDENRLDEKFKDIVIVLGNHEYWHHELFTLPFNFKAEAETFKNVHLLHNATEIISGVRFIGGTLWTDFDNGNALYMMQAKMYMNDYLHMYGITPDDILLEHEKAREALKDVLIPSDLKTVVMTHHLPSWNLIDGYYRQTSTPAINSCYAANCDKYLEEGFYNVWQYGHTHDSLMLKDERSTVVCNPKGYGNENKNFKKDLRIEL